MAAASSDPLFLPDLPRVKQQTELNNLRALFLQLMRQGDAQPDSFPGSQPVSFERRHMNADQQVSLQRMGFYASEKTDGMRYMLLVLGERGAYAVDRRFEFIKLPAMHFPARGGGAPLDETLLDGELVLDAVRRGTEEGTIETRRSLRYLAYDACAVSGTWLMDKPLPLRLLALQREVLGPRYEAGATGRDLSSEPFAVDQKDFFSIRHLQHIFQQVKPGGSGGEHLYAYQDELRKVEHGNDGVIFTPILEPYVCGTCPSLLKWKPATMNSDRLSASKRKDGGPACVSVSRPT